MPRKRRNKIYKIYADYDQVSKTFSLQSIDFSLCSGHALLTSFRRINSHTVLKSSRTVLNDNINLKYTYISCIGYTKALCS